jgi:quinate dehydrogenase (quinone)
MAQSSSSEPAGGGLGELGAAKESGPLSFNTGLRVVTGSGPNVDGAMTTSNSRSSIGAADDRRLSVFKTQTRRKLRSERWPEGSQATPMTYLVSTSGSQPLAAVSGRHVFFQKNVPPYVCVLGLAS